MYEAILFDFDGTLVDFVNADIQSLKYVHARTQSQICFDAFLETSLEKLPVQVRTGLISNAYDAKEQRARIRHSGLEAYFDTIVIAGEVDVYKPDPSIFQLALGRLGVAPGKALYIGDSVTYDVLGAKSAGMQTALVCEQPDDCTAPADYIILRGMEGFQSLLDQFGKEELITYH
jgi:putative hydrolase of the HAD superfamily